MGSPNSAWTKFQDLAASFSHRPSLGLDQTAHADLKSSEVFITRVEKSHSDSYIYKSTHLIAFTDIYSAVLLKFNHSSAIRLSEFQVGKDNSIASNSHSNLDMRIFF